MKSFILNLLILFTIVSCSGGGEGGGEDTSLNKSILPDGDEVAINDFLKLIPNHDPLAHKALSFSGQFNFNKGNKKCSGSMVSKISVNKIKSEVTSSGYCKGKGIKRKIVAGSLEFLNVENFADALGENLKIYDLGSDEFRLSFEGQENWGRSYMVKVDKKTGTILLPVTLVYNYSDQYQKMNYEIVINKGSDIIDAGAQGRETVDAMDMAEYGIYSIF